MGTQKVTSLTRKEMENVEEIKKCKIGIIGISETKRKGPQEIILDENYMLRYSGLDNTMRPKWHVGIIISEELNRSVIKRIDINSRIIRLDTELQEKPVTHKYMPLQKSLMKMKRTSFIIHFKIQQTKEQKNKSTLS